MNARYAPGVSPIPVGSSLNPIQYIRNEKIMGIKKKSVLPRISVFKGFGKCGTAFNIRHEFETRDRAQEVEYGGILKPVTVRMPREQLFMIGDKMGVSLAWEECNWEKIQANDPSFVQEVIDSYQSDTMLSFDSRAFSTIIGEAHAKNRGTNAGYQSANINLGTQANPLVTNPDTVWGQHYGMQRVMSEMGLNYSSTGRTMYAVVAEGYMENIALNDRLSAYYYNGQCHVCSSPVMGDTRQVDQVEYIKSRCLPVINDGGSMIYPILFGYDDALWAGYDVAIDYKEGGRGDSNKYIDIYWHFGLKLIDPRKVGVMWVRVEPLVTGG